MAGLKTNKSRNEKSKETQIPVFPGEKYFHYNQTGSLFWGMHEFTVTEARYCCEKHGYFVNMTSIDNYGSIYTKSVYKESLEREYFKNELDAWKAYQEDLKRQIHRRRTVIARLEVGVSEAQARIAELSEGSERP
jgi:hypothetical protein